MTTSARGWEIERVGQIAINVRDIANATSFYRDVLGLKFLFAAPPGLAFFDCGGVRLMLAAPESPRQEQYSSVVYYVVPSVTDAHRALSQSGVKFESEPHIVARVAGVEIWMVFLKDPDGNLLALTSEVATSE